MGIVGSFVVSLQNKEGNNNYKDHVFLSLYDKKKALGVLTHEMLHSMEKTRRINPETGEYEEKTGFKEYGDSSDRTLESECIHSIILHKRIYPELRKLGYDIYDKNDYDLMTLESNNEFFDKYEQEILEARCGNEQALYNVVGKENFDKLVQLQNEVEDNIMSPEKMEEINQKAKQVLHDMEEYQKRAIGEPTNGKTIMTTSLTDNLAKEYENAGINQEDLNKAYEIINRTKEEREQETNHTNTNKVEGRG